MNRILKAIFELVVAIQFVCFIVFVVSNINTLDSVSYTFTLSEDDYAMTIDFYDILEIITIIFVVTIITSLSILGVGFSSEGTKTIVKYISFTLLFIILGLGTSYYLQGYPQVLLIFELFSAIVYFFYLMWSNMEKTDVD